MLTRRRVGALGIALALAGRARAEDPFPITGSWNGVISMGAVKLRLRLDVGPGGEVTLTSLDQGGAQRMGHAAVGANGAIRIEVEAVGVFVGRQTAANRIEAAFQPTNPGQAPASIPLVLERGPSSQGPATSAVPALTRDGLEALRRGCSAPALAAAAQRHGGPTLSWACGVRMAGRDVRVGTDDQWHLGSISKSFLATMAGRLVDQGRLAWGETLGDALASEGWSVPEPYRSATFLHLFSHRAGLTDIPPLHQLRAFDASGADERAQRRVLLQTAFATPPVAPLGAKTLYSNIGYAAAAAMIEARTGMAWQALIQREVFQPLGLKSGGFGPPGRAGALVEPVGHGVFVEQPYRPHPPGQPNADLPLVLGPAGRIHMSLAELTTYLAAHRDRTGLLKPATWDTLHTPHFDQSYALGWNVWPDGSFTHDGSNLLWYAVAQFNPRTGLVGAAAANDGRASVWNSVGEAARQAMAAV